MIGAKFLCSVVVCARWETRYILEWLTYYKSIGYDHVYLYCNDDDPEDLYKISLPFLVGSDPFVTFIHFKGQGLQHQMYLHFLDNYHSETMWVSFFDVDEFLYLPGFENNIKNLMPYFFENDCVLFYWLIFGDNYHQSFPDGSVLENYTRRAIGINSYTKYICRTACLLDNKIFSPEGFGFWHNPQWHSHQEIKIVDILNRTHFDIGSLSEHQIESIQNTASVHHYMIKSREYLTHRIQRGTGGAFAGQVIWDTTEESRKKAIEASMEEFNAIEDKSLYDYWNNLTKKASSVGVPAFNESNKILISSYGICNQSSVSPWSRGPTTFEDSVNAINGETNGIYKFHTGEERDPWWQIDFGKNLTVSDIVIFNVVSRDMSGRLRNIKILSSHDGNYFDTVFEKTDGLEVGSILTSPLCVSLNIEARFIRIVSLGFTFLHLDQVKIYGQ